jgi:hypothetical protein
MILDHWRLRRLVPLLAVDALTGGEQARAAAHVRTCTKCRAEHDAVRALMARLGEDPLRARVRSAEVPLALPVLVDLVEKRIDHAIGGGRRAPSRAWRLSLPVAAAAALAALVLGPRLFERRPPPEPPHAPPALASPAPSVSAAALERLERNVAREQAARYLSDAQDVLATVAASPRDCDRAERRVDVEAEGRRSRELLARRALLLDVDGEAVASAQPVLDDVEQILREVASMEACVRFGDLERLQGEIERRQLLMKVRLMQRELLG